MHQLSSILEFFLLSGLMGGPTHLARGQLGRHDPHKPYQAGVWAYKVACGPARHGPSTWPDQCRPGQDGPGPGRAARLAIYKHASCTSCSCQQCVLTTEATTAGTWSMCWPSTRVFGWRAAGVEPFSLASPLIKSSPDPGHGGSQHRPGPRCNTII
jgi:hypothetical protein